MKIYTYCLALFLFLLMSCNSKKQTSLGEWRFAENENYLLKVTKDSVLYFFADSGMLKPMGPAQGYQLSASQDTMHFYGQVGMDTGHHHWVLRFYGTDTMDVYQTRSRGKFRYFRSAAPVSR